MRPTRGEATSAAVQALFDKEQQSRILTRWLGRVRDEIAAANRESTPILVDTLPLFLQHLAEAVSPKPGSRTDAAQGSTVPAEHGSERARLTDYRLDELIREYQLLREVVLEVLDETAPPSASERAAIIRSFDRAIVDSSSSWVLASDESRHRFVVSLAHDLRGPLSAAKTAAGLILRRPDSPDVPRLSARIVEHVDRADRMLRDLLDSSRVRAGGRLSLTVAAADLVDIASRAIESLQLVHGDRFHFQHAGPLRGHWSAEALTRALENLLSNAVKYGDGTRPITVTVAEQHGTVSISVHNHGSYLDPEERAALFQAFHRGKAAQDGKRGWGIGLSVVRAVAEAHGGSINVDSDPQRGTTFTIALPFDARPFQRTADAR